MTKKKASAAEEESVPAEKQPAHDASGEDLGRKSSESPKESKHAIGKKTVSMAELPPRSSAVDLEKKSSKTAKVAEKEPSAENLATTRASGTDLEKRKSAEGKEPSVSAVELPTDASGADLKKKSSKSTKAEEGEGKAAGKESASAAKLASPDSGKKAGKKGKKKGKKSAGKKSGSAEELARSSSEDLDRRKSEPRKGSAPAVEVVQSRASGVDLGQKASKSSKKESASAAELQTSGVDIGQKSSKSLKMVASEKVDEKVSDANLEPQASDLEKSPKKGKGKHKKKKKPPPSKFTSVVEITFASSAADLETKPSRKSGIGLTSSRISASALAARSSGKIISHKTTSRMSAKASMKSMKSGGSLKHPLPEVHKSMSETSSVSSGVSGSEESYEEIIEEHALDLTTTPKKRHKKAKKGKPKKKKKKEESEEEEEEGDVVKPAAPVEDYAAEIAKMKQLAELQAIGITDEGGEEEEPKKKKKKKKKGPKKKLSKKEKARLAAEQAEKARANAEEELARQAELERIRLEEERKAAIEKEKRETFEQQIRMEQLETSLGYLGQLIEYNKQLREAAKAQAEWEFYVDCGRLPNPSRCDQMNTFLHLWENMIEETTMEEAAKRTQDMLDLLNDLDNLIDTAEEPDSDLVKNWKWVRLLFRQQQAKSLDVATYRLLRDIEKNLNRIDIPTADYKYQDDNIALCLWLRIQLPTPLPNPRRPPKPRIDVNFPEMKMEVQFPLSVDGEKMAVRALYVKYDHLSDLSTSYQKPPIPEPYDINLYEAMKAEWRQKLLYKYENRVRKTPPVLPVGKEGEEETAEAQLPPPEPIIGPEDDVPIVPYRKLEPTASEYVITNEDALYDEVRAKLVRQVDNDVINLRKYSIIGGVYALNLIHQPPQPQDFVTMEMTLTPLYLPKELELVDFFVPFTPIPPEALSKLQAEEIEEIMKKQDEELEKLIQITVTWPDHVIFLELPMVCHWDSSRQVWTKSEVHDLKHNEEKGQLSFRTGKCGTFALATYRYANLPYQAWEIRPETNGSISLQITAAILMVEFNVKDGLIALSQLQNSPNNALQDMVGTYFALPKLIRIMQSSGVDVFPAFDAFCYIENTCEKHWPMEKHLYYDMAQLSICFNFAWSRWNLPAGRRGVVMQMREYNLEKTKQKNHLMCHVTPLKAIYVDCTEVSPVFSEEGMENMKFYPDLFQLIRGTSSMALKNKIKNASKELVNALYELLIATRVVSFS